MTHLADLKPGLYRGRWADSYYVGPVELHKFEVVGEGVVIIPDCYINQGRRSMEINDMAQLAIEVSPMIANVAGDGRRYYVRDVLVRVVSYDEPFGRSARLVPDCTLSERIRPDFQGRRLM